jgi:hypothetical protein
MIDLYAFNVKYHYHQLIIQQYIIVDMLAIYYIFLLALELLDFIKHL